MVEGSVGISSGQNLFHIDDFLHQRLRPINKNVCLIQWLNIVSHNVLIVSTVRFVRLESEACHHRLTSVELTFSQVAEHCAVVLVLIVTTQLTKSDVRLSQLATFLFLTRNIRRFRLLNHLSNDCLHLFSFLHLLSVTPVPEWTYLFSFNDGRSSDFSPVCLAFPAWCSASGNLVSRPSVLRGLQQQVLFRIFTGFPCTVVACATWLPSILRRKGTTISVTVKDYHVKKPIPKEKGRCALTQNRFEITADFTFCSSGMTISVFSSAVSVRLAFSGPPRFCLTLLGLRVACRPPW